MELDLEKIAVINKIMLVLLTSSSITYMFIIDIKINKISPSILVFKTPKS